MNKYVSVKKLDDGRTRIDLKPVEGTNRGYQIFFEESAAGFTNNVCQHIRVECGTRLDLVKAGAVFKVTFYENKERKPSYSVILNDCEWTKNHIEDIEKQLVEQVREVQYQLELQKNMKMIEEAIKTQGYSTLIQQLIKQHADDLTDMQVMDIQRTLTDVKEEKGLTSRPSIF